MPLVQTALARRRLARWRRCSKLRYVLSQRIERLELVEAHYGPDPNLTRQLERLREQRDNITRTIERLEAKERKRVSA